MLDNVDQGLSLISTPEVHAEITGHLYIFTGGKQKKVSRDQLDLGRNTLKAAKSILLYLLLNYMIKR